MSTLTARHPSLPLRRLAWAALFAGSLGAALALDAGAWQLWALLVAPDAALFVGFGRGLEKGQLHPRAVPLYNALHRPIGPIVLAIASVWLGQEWLVGALAWLAHISIDRAVGYGLRDARGYIKRGD
jgi:hypothetical protein